jgi:PAS domain S-box-containing protein
MSLQSGTTLWADTLERQLVNLNVGAHVCPLYESAEEQLRALVPFFRAGIQQGEQCVYVADRANVDELRANGVGTQSQLEDRVVVVFTSRETYLRDGRFDPQTMIDFWRAADHRARLDGFRGIRVVGEMSWALGAEVDSRRLIEYEALLNNFLPQTRIRALCQYNSQRFKPDVVRDVLRTHPLAILGERLHDNPYFEPPGLVLEGSEVDRERLEWMIDRLVQRTQRELAVTELGRLSLMGAAQSDLMQAAARVVAAELQVDSVEVHERGQSGEPQPTIAIDADGVTISIGYGRRQYGILRVGSNRSHIYSEHEVAFLDSVATLLAHAIERAHAEAEFRALVEHAPDAIVRFDRELRITYVNPTTERLIGVSAERLLGKSSRELGLPDPDASNFELVLRQVVRMGREQTIEHRLLAGNLRDFQTRIVPEFTPGPNPSVDSLLAIGRDITDLKRAAVERQAHAETLLEEKRRQQQLLEQLLGDQRAENRRLERATLLNKLTRRERDVLRLIAQGWSNREIGLELHLSPGTVKNHVARLLHKLDVVDRSQAAARAGEMGLQETNQD